MTDSTAPLPPASPRRWIRWSIAAIALVLLLAIGWVVVRGLSAVSSLQTVRTAAAQLRSDVASGDLTRAADRAHDLEREASSAHALTSDPVWRAFEILPWIGADFTAVREVSRIADSIAADGVQPLLEASDGIDLTGFGLRDGAVDLAPFEKAQKPLSSASAAFSRAVADAGRIRVDGLLPPLADAVSELRDAIGEADSVMATLHDSATLIPPMLGGDGPRTYIVAMLNNAELKSAGGIIGALAVVRADEGRISIVGNASTVDFPPLVEPLPVSAATNALFGDGPGRYVQNIASIPDFTEGAPLLAERWRGAFGGDVDGVIAVDTVVAQRLLRVTGPQQVGPLRLDADNALTVLLSDVYRDLPDPRAQDAVFAETAAKLFSAAMRTDDPRALLAAMTDAADQNRIRLWSAHADEQRILAASSLGGALPRDTAEQPVVGVLINDTTGGKMDFYARADIVVATGVCHGDATTRVTVTWRSTAPADAASTLPEYVTAGGHYGVPAGSIRSLIAVYGPEGATPARIERDGAQEPVQTAGLDGRIAVQHDVLLAPGESTTITVDYIGAGAGVRSTAVVHTPMAFGPDVASGKLVCGS
ncbi:DUF4012 domain-containing protein [Microbacterium sp. ARD32]|uniref:DUF4012 domain-containing protein n=1 Tax=Microbacterium sp. ARD32 TaxID=2962577 RepID=UPI002881153C|nr:DUF4012 domain-containing protein [Microbacterium sp. ARD32]MDT0156739.1 DUF4012 domain-containing protein [Microbacterium sp. ARD32]